MHNVHILNKFRKYRNYDSTEFFIYINIVKHLRNKKLKTCLIKYLSHCN